MTDFLEQISRGRARNSIGALLAFLLPLACAGTYPRGAGDSPPRNEGTAAVSKGGAEAKPEEGRKGVRTEPLEVPETRREPLPMKRAHEDSRAPDTKAPEEPLKPIVAYGVGGKELSEEEVARAPSGETGHFSEASSESLGLSGSAVGGGGYGFGSGHGRLGGSHKAAPRPRPSAAPAPRPASAPKLRAAHSSSGKKRMAASPARAQSSGVAAGEWDDNANLREFRKFLAAQSSTPFHHVDVSTRRFLVVKDSTGKPVPNCIVEVKEQSGRRVSLVTGASGRAAFFPAAEGLSRVGLTASTHCQGAFASSNFDAKADDGVVALALDKERRPLVNKTVDVVFILDTTGSMSEEISQLKSTITKVADLLGESGARIRLGMVEYRDRGDAFLTRVHQMTTDVSGFIGRVDQVHANGGGDMPEDVNEGLAVALERLNWNDDSVVRAAFLIGDAPPQLSYQDSISYAQSMRRAAHEGIHLYTIAASGMDDLGQVVWRQLAQYTGGTNMFVLRGGAGPQSVGGGDPKSSCGGTHKNYTTNNLSELIRSKIAMELSALQADPMKIAGLHRDEKAKPCDQRIAIVQAPEAD